MDGRLDNNLTISIYVRNVSSHIVGVVLYIWFDIFIVFQNIISIIIDVFSIVYFRLKNYRNTDAVFTYDNIVSFSFLTKKMSK